MSTLWEIIAGIALGAVLAWLGGRTGLLTRGAQAVLGATIVAVFAMQRWTWGSLVAISVLANGLAMRYRRDDKRSLHGFRGAWQRMSGWEAVLVRLGWPLVLAILSGSGRVDQFPAFVGSLATVSADVWGTELGVLSVEQPRLLINRLRALPGTPGAVSLLGILASVGAAWLTGFVALLLRSIQSALAASEGLFDRSMSWLPLAALAGGVIGVLTDSVLGGTAQAFYYCEACEAYCEEPVHDCGQPAQHVRGWSWMTNETIDLVSVLVGAGATAAAAVLLHSI